MSPSTKAAIAKTKRRGARLVFRGISLASQKVLQYHSNSDTLVAMLTGYARVFTDDQDTAAEVTALRAAGCDRNYRGGRWDRPEHYLLLDPKADMLVVWKLDRAFAEFERAMLKDGIKVGLDAARGDGWIGGDSPKLSCGPKLARFSLLAVRTVANAARFSSSPGDCRRLLAKPADGRSTKPHNVDGSMPSNSESGSLSMFTLRLYYTGA